MVNRQIWPSFCISSAGVEGPQAKEHIPVKDCFLFVFLPSCLPAFLPSRLPAFLYRCMPACLPGYVFSGYVFSGYGFSLCVFFSSP